MYLLLVPTFCAICQIYQHDNIHQSGLILLVQRFPSQLTHHLLMRPQYFWRSFLVNFQHRQRRWTDQVISQNEIHQTGLGIEINLLVRGDGNVRYAVREAATSDLVVVAVVRSVGLLRGCVIFLYISHSPFPSFFFSFMLRLQRDLLPRTSSSGLCSPYFAPPLRPSFHRDLASLLAMLRLLRRYRHCSLLLASVLSSSVDFS